MVFILNSNRNKKLSTIKGELLQYTKEIFLLVLLVLSTGIYIFFVMTLEIAKGSEQVFAINDFYSGMQEEQQLLYEFVTEQDVKVYPELYRKNKELFGIVEKIEKFQVTTEFKRDIQDIYKILQQYREKMEKIYMCVEKEDTFSEILTEFYEAEHMSTLIGETFQSINQQITKACQYHTEKAKEKSFLCASVLVWIIFLFVWYLFLRIHCIEDNIMNPIQILMSRLKVTNLTNFENSQVIEEINEANDDIALLIDVYNSMVRKIQKQLLEREEHINIKLKLKEQELLNLQISNELRKSQMTNLQSQMNPHFLFNTLNMISHTAYMENGKETVELLQITSDLLRYALDYSDKTVTLGKEIEHLGNYVSLQEKRFGERIHFRFELDESFHDVKVPNLILQPLVENAVSHGIGMYTEGGKIIIRTEYLKEEKLGKISIIDNGEGMDAEVLENVKNRMHCRTGETGKIGLSNVYFRLNCFFENKADIIINSIPKVRTEVAILIPCSNRKDGGENEL